MNYKVLDLVDIHKQITPFTDEGLSDFLELSASFMNIEEGWPSEPSFRRAHRAIMDGKVYSAARQRLLAVVRQVKPDCDNEVEEV
jgi:hypothetical protein